MANLKLAADKFYFQIGACYDQWQKNHTLSIATTVMYPFNQVAIGAMQLIIISKSLNSIIKLNLRLKACLTYKRQKNVSPDKSPYTDQDQDICHMNNLIKLSDPIFGHFSLCKNNCRWYFLIHHEKKMKSR